MAQPAVIQGSGSAVSEDMPVADAEAFAQFEQELEYLRQALKIPGMSAAIVQDQELVWAKGFGHADREDQVEATPDTPYLLASVTKPIAATLIMQLVEEGMLHLDDPISKYGVDLEGEGVVRVYHLLTHTSEGVPGTRHRYSGERYMRLADVIETVSGKSFAELLSERILEPLDMTNTAPNYPQCDLETLIASSELDERDRNHARVNSELAKPYQLDQSYNVVQGGYHSYFGTSAGLISSVIDLAKFDIALDQNALLSRETKEQMFAPAFSTHGNSTDLAYGLGWYIQRYNGTRLIWHAGRMPPSISALYVKAPDEHLTFIILANTANLSTPYPLGNGDVLYSTLALAFYETFVFPRKYGKTVPQVDWEADEQDLVSQWKRVTDEDVREILERELWSYRQLFASVGRLDLVNRLVDVRGKACQWSSLKNPDLDLYLFRGVEQLAPVGERIELGEAELQRFVGHYRLSRWPEIEGDSPPSEMSVAVQDGNLIACAPGMGRLSLIPVAPARFRILYVAGNPNGYVTFDMDGDKVETATFEINDTIEVVYEPKE
jgi:CubicO group peptidase (beta-lactamase class C family)